VSEIAAGGVDIERRKRVAAHSLAPAHLPGVDPCIKGRRLRARLSHAAAREGFAEAVSIGASDRGMTHPDLLIGPAFLLCTRRHGLTEQGPLRAKSCTVCVCEVGGDVPPLDAEVGMRTVI